MRQDSIIRKIAVVMRKMFPEATTLLFGSQARGTASMNSDIDLLILLPDTVQGKAFVTRRSEIVGQLYDIEIEHGVRVSPIVLLKSIWESRQTPFSINVNREGILL
jgi:predicted nucleotidyltransferase